MDYAVWIMVVLIPVYIVDEDWKDAARNRSRQPNKN